MPSPFPSRNRWEDQTCTNHILSHLSRTCLHRPEFFAHDTRKRVSRRIETCPHSPSGMLSPKVRSHSHCSMGSSIHDEFASHNMLGPKAPGNRLRSTHTFLDTQALCGHYTRVHQSLGIGAYRRSLWGMLLHLTCIHLDESRNSNKNVESPSCNMAFANTTNIHLHALRNVLHKQEFCRSLHHTLECQGICEESLQGNREWGTLPPWVCIPIYH